jgi:DMSO reductase family type II enzyme heme b subunit
MRSSAKTVLTFALPLLALGSLYFVVIRGMSQRQSPAPREEEPLTIRYTRQDVPLDPGAEYWTGIEPTKIQLYPQVARVPFGTEERVIWVRGVYSDDEITLHLQFDDETENWGDQATPDACAIMFTPGDTPATGQMMGHGSAANIWHWLAGSGGNSGGRETESTQQVRELIASGPATQTPMENQNVVAKGEYHEGKWMVVFKRPLESQQDGELALLPGVDRKVSFAVWDGALMESFSRKSIAILRTLKLEQD